MLVLGTRSSDTACCQGYRYEWPRSPQREYPNLAGTAQGSDRQFVPRKVAYIRNPENTDIQLHTGVSGHTSCPCSTHPVSQMYDICDEWKSSSLYETGYGAQWLYAAAPAGWSRTVTEPPWVRCAPNRTGEHDGRRRGFLRCRGAAGAGGESGCAGGGCPAAAPMTLEAMLGALRARGHESVKLRLGKVRREFLLDSCKKAVSRAESGSWGFERVFLSSNNPPPTALGDKAS